MTPDVDVIRLDLKAMYEFVSATDGVFDVLDVKNLQSRRPRPLNPLQKLAFPQNTCWLMANDAYVKGSKDDISIIISTP